MPDREDSFHGVNLNLNIRGLPQSATVAINERSNRLRGEGREIFKLGLGQSPFPVPGPVVAALREHAAEKDYLPTRGLRELREVIAAYHRREFGIDCQGDDVLIGPGSKELMFLLQLVYYGDLVIPTPSWVSYAPQAQIIGRHIRRLRTHRVHDWHMSSKQLEELCVADRSRPRIVILNYPSNPTGRTLSEKRLRSLARVARENRVILLSDEIYGRLDHAGTHHSIVPHYPEGTVYSSGLSKWCGAGGWRLGYFVFPRALRWLLDSMAAVASETFTSTSAPIQYAAVSAFRDNPEIDEYLVHSRRVLECLGALLTRILREAGAFLLDPEGAFYLFPDFADLKDRLRARGIRTSLRMCEQLLEETGVAILPGSDFGRPAQEYTARIAYVDFDGAAALEASRAIPLGEALGEPFAREHMPRVVEAVERLCEWIQK